MTRIKVFVDNSDYGKLVNRKTVKVLVDSIGQEIIECDLSFNLPEEEPKKLYEGDDVLVREPWQLEKIEGYSGAYCKCGHVLHIKTPKVKAFYPIKCPKCGFVTNLFCGEKGRKLSMEDLE